MLNAKKSREKISSGMVVLVVERNGEDPSLLDALSDQEEIEVFEERVLAGDSNPLREIYARREHQYKEDEEFGDYIEEILSQPFVKKELRDQGVQWFRSKIKIEEYQKGEKEATRIIAGYAYQLYLKSRSKKEFILEADQASVQVRIFELRRDSHLKAHEDSDKLEKSA